MDDKILTLHPQGKKGVRIDRAKYDAVKAAILKALRAKELTHHELTQAVEDALQGKFDGSVAWYMESTKLDLEARHVIERVPGERHDVYRVRGSVTSAGDGHQAGLARDSAPLGSSRALGPPRTKS